MERADQEAQQSADRHSVYATRPLSELLWHHPPRTLCSVQRLAVEVPQLQNQAAALSQTEAAAVLKEAIGVPQTMRKERGPQGEAGTCSPFAYVSDTPW